MKTLSISSEESLNFGSPEPRICTPSRSEFTLGDSLIEFSRDLVGVEFMPWQEFAARRSLECDSTGRLISGLVVIMAARQQGKTAFLVSRILWELFVRGSKLSIHTAQDRALARDIFEKVVETIESSPFLSAEIKMIRLANGQESIKLKSGSVYKILAPTEAAARGLSVDGVAIIDEAREAKDWGLWGAFSKTTLATDNPQIILTSNAGHSLSLMLNSFQDKGRAAAGDPNLDPNLCFMEWSADPRFADGDRRGWIQANPALGHGFVTFEKLEAAFNTDPIAVFKTEVLCQRVESMQSILPESAWEDCANPEFARIEEGSTVFLAFDITPSRDEAALVAACVTEAGIVVSVVEHWFNPRGINEQEIAASVQAWASAYVVPAVGYDPRFSWSVAARIEANGVIVRDIGGVKFYRASQEFFEAVVNKRIIHPDDEYLNSQIEASARQDVADGSWRISRKNSGSSIAAVVALAMAIHLASDPSSGAMVF